MPGNVLKDFTKLIKETFSRGLGASHSQESSGQDEKGTGRGGGMRINFERTGGFMGMHLALEVTTETMTPAEADELEMLVESARFFDLPAILEPGTEGVDQFQYKVTVERGNQFHTVETSDSATPEDLQPLIERLTHTARSQRII